MSSLKSQGYSVFGLPDFGWAGVIWNFKNTVHHFDKIISQLYFRQVMAMLVNEPAIIAGIYHGAAGLAYGPIPSVPEDAVRAVQRGQPAATRTTRPRRCRSSRPTAGTSSPTGRRPAPIRARVPTSAAPAFPRGRRSPSPGPPETAAAGPYVPLTDEAVTSEAKQAAGINIQLFQKTFNYIASNYNNADPSVAKYTNDWAVENFSGYTDSPYPTQNSIFNTGGSFNSGAYTDPKMDQLIQNSVFGSDPNAVTKEASYESEQLPALFLPNYDLIYGVANRVGGTPQSYLSLTQYGLWPQFWWVNKK